MIVGVLYVAVSCGAGTFTDVINNQCVSCPVDQYQNDTWQITCNRCPQGHGTPDGVTGADDSSYCTREFIQTTVNLYLISMKIFPDVSQCCNTDVQSRSSPYLAVRLQL